MKDFVSVVSDSERRSTAALKLLVKFNTPYDESEAGRLSAEGAKILESFQLKIKKTKSIPGSIILSYDIEDESFLEFYKAADLLEQKYEDVLGFGLVYDGQVDNFLEDADEYEITFVKWITFHSTVKSVTIKDTESPLMNAVYCRSTTKAGILCRNKTKDPSQRCWRHRF